MGSARCDPPCQRSITRAWPPTSSNVPERDAAAVSLNEAVRPQSVVRARLRSPRERYRRELTGMRERVARLDGRKIAAAVVSRDKWIQSQSVSRCVVGR
jgi:hypothetical protein